MINSNEQATEYCLLTKVAVQATIGVKVGEEPSFQLRSAELFRQSQS